jgi:hypothetical protein
MDDNTPDRADLSTIVMPKDKVIARADHPDGDDSSLHEPADRNTALTARDLLGVRPDHPGDGRG